MNFKKNTYFTLHEELKNSRMMGQLFSFNLSTSCSALSIFFFKLVFQFIRPSSRSQNLQSDVSTRGDVVFKDQNFVS